MASPASMTSTPASTFACVAYEPTGFMRSDCKHCYKPKDQHTREMGVVQWYDGTKGSGVIESVKTRTTYFVSWQGIAAFASAAKRGLSPAEGVEFQPEGAPAGQLRAVLVTGPRGAPVQGAAPRAHPKPKPAPAVATLPPPVAGVSESQMIMMMKVMELNTAQQVSGVKNENAMLQAEIRAMKEQGQSDKSLQLQLQMAQMQVHGQLAITDSNVAANKDAQMLALILQQGSASAYGYAPAPRAHGRLALTSSADEPHGDRSRSSSRPAHHSSGPRHSSGKAPPPGYVCKLCDSTAHFVGDCSLAIAPKKPCRDHANGKCTYGHKCKFSHK